MSVVLRSAQNSVLVLTTANLYTSMNLVVAIQFALPPQFIRIIIKIRLAIGIGDENY